VHAPMVKSASTPKRGRKRSMPVSFATNVPRGRARRTAKFEFSAVGASDSSRRLSTAVDKDVARTLRSLRRGVDGTARP
jgi:hypothetical protein